MSPEAPSCQLTLTSDCWEDLSPSLAARGTDSGPGTASASESTEAPNVSDRGWHFSSVTEVAETLGTQAGSRLPRARLGEGPRICQGCDR